MRLRFLFVSIFLCLASNGFASGDQCSVVQDGTQLEIKSPFFVYRLSTDDGLRAKSWTNLLSGSTIVLSGPEIEVDLGDTPENPTAIPLAVSEVKIQGSGSLLATLLNPQKTLAVEVNYQWDSETPFLHKYITLTNRSDAQIRVLNVRAGAYISDADIQDKIQVVPTGVFGSLARTGDKEPGFPLYLNDDFVLSLAHPAGWSTNLNGVASLRQYPGVKLSPQESFKCMEAVYGVGAKGEARKNFVDHVRSRSRRVVRNHDKPYAIYDNFASWKNGVFANKEEYMLESLSKVAKSQEAVGRIFDICNIHFWVDYAGDLKKWDKERFPNGYESIRPVLENLGIKPGLWIDSSMRSWTIGRNPETRPSLAHDPAYFCRASEPIKSMYREAFVQHIRDGKVRLLKFDNLHALVCNNPDHDHLPGVYSTEAIENSVIEFLHDLDKECPEVFLMLYWGYRSPWWLLHADTLFDAGTGYNEAASPSQYPSVYVRDSVAQRLDQFQILCDDLPWLGKDSLGIWLSNWPWNSCIGKERWQEGVIMDICRGSLLLQIWSDYDFLSPPEWEQLADFAALLKAQPKCFANPQVIIGNPNNPEPYGYCCTDGQRAFLAINHCTWNDGKIPLELGSKWGLPDGKRWDIYRWYPDPVKLIADDDGFKSGISVLCQPFEIMLFEVVPAGEKPSLDRAFAGEKMASAFVEKSRELTLTVVDTTQQDHENEQKAEKNNWTVLSPTSLTATNGSTLARESDDSIFASGANPILESYTVITQGKLDGVTAFRLELLPDSRLPLNGPGRVYNGNIALNELKISVIDSGRETPIVLKKASANFSQRVYGNYMVENVIDSKPETAWSIYPLSGIPVTAVFETERPISITENGSIVFVLNQGDHSSKDAHNIGHFRLSATTDKTVLPCLPKGPREFIVETESPETEIGGTLVITTEVSHDSQPFWFHNIDQLTASATVNGSFNDTKPIVKHAGYPSCWQGWRLDIAPNSPSQKIEFKVSPDFPYDTDFTFKSHFIPNKKIIQ